jgi:vitamin K-dependent gamma-carboxylase
METRLRALAERLVQRPVDMASIAAFRIIFGLLMAAAMIRFLAKGWVSDLYTKPLFHFSYAGFEWVRPLPDGLMHGVFILLALLGLGIAAGLFYRVCIALFFLGFTYVELIDQTLYLNHYYLVSLVSGLMIFLPAHRLWSIDALRGPEIRCDTAPAWALNILRFQIALVYIFAGIAKLNADWLFRAQPLRIWLAARSDLPIIGPLLDEAWVAFIASWVGAIFDLSIVCLLMCARTRKPAYAVLVLFHLATLVLFNIGMFPWIMIVSGTLFFAPSWPRRFIRIEAVRGHQHTPTSTFTCGLLAIYAGVQLCLPLRPYFQSEPAAWTGSRFNCAWQVMIVEKTGYAEFFAFDPSTGQKSKVSMKGLLTRRQEMMMAQDPYLLLAMGRQIARTHPGPEIRCEAFASLNGRPAQRLIDPNVNLAGRLPTRWILPFEGGS